jgi:hypothetical protein
LTYPVLRQPDVTRPFTVYTDASGYALGAILAQHDDNNQEYVCHYASRLLKNAEIHYGISEKKCLAIVYAIRQFRIYLHGVHFTVVTDHNALVWLMSVRDPTGKLARWSIYLQQYDYTIIHRQGRKHSNVDTLSRPVLSIQIHPPDSSEPPPLLSYLSDVDPYEDEALLNYLQFGRHLAGQSKKKCKNVLFRSKHYKYSEDKLWYRKDIKSDNYLEVPKRQLRYNLIHHEHFMGHYQTQTVYAALVTTYYWPHMREDIIHYIKHCGPCIRHHLEPEINHSAQVINPIKIFDRFGADLVLGLPLTEEGYNGILLITEYLTKFPHGFPIKTKTAQEIAERLFEYIALFGPSDLMLSDMGKEFVAQVVQQLCENCGIQHDTTAAYNPRTNGLTERFNQTLCESLRKHAEANPLDWVKWLPYVLMCYRRRVHSITGYSPFQLMFGRQMKHFGDWRVQEAEDEVLALRARAEEIQKLVHLFQPAALRAIEEHHPAQQIAQNSQHRIDDTILQAGTTVYLKAEGLLGKLEPRYRGPYTIFGQDKKGNYQVQNALGSVLKTVYPRHKIKVVPPPEEDETEHYEVEKILKHRRSTSTKQLEYFVKWKNHPQSENSWVKESNFNTMEIISDYWKNLGTSPKPTTTCF